MKAIAEKIGTADQFLIKGTHRVTTFDFSRNVRKAASLEQEIQRLMERPHQNRRAYVLATERLKDLCGEKEQVIENLVALRTRSIVAERLGSVNTYSLNLSHGAVGTGTTTPVAADTQLGTEINRVAYASVDSSQTASGIIIISFFWSRSSFTNAAVAEFGNFVDGSASANSGRLCSHILFASPINKTAQKSLTVDSQYTINSA